MSDSSTRPQRAHACRRIWFITCETLAIFPSFVWLATDGFGPYYRIIRVPHLAGLALLLITSLVYVGYEHKLAVVGFLTLGTLLAIALAVPHVTE